MDGQKAWILVFGTLLIFSLAAFGMVFLVVDTLRTTVQPVQSMTGDMATQVSTLLQPTPTIIISPISIIRDIRSLARLETIQYTVEKVVTAEKNLGSLSPLFGDKLIFVAHGQVTAGIDLSKMGPEDIEMIEGVVWVTLPEPEVFSASLDSEKSYVYDRETGLLTKGDIQLESSARSAAEKAIRQAALDDGILEMARQNGENYLSRLLRDLGFPEAQFRTGE